LHFSHSEVLLLVLSVSLSCCRLRARSPKTQDHG